MYGMSNVYDANLWMSDHFASQKLNHTKPVEITHIDNPK